MKRDMLKTPKAAGIDIPAAFGVLLSNETGKTGYYLALKVSHRVSFEFWPPAP